MTSNYRRGADFERKVRALLQDRGYLCWRCAGSKGEGSVDLIAAKSTELLLVQCKLDGKMTNSERWGLLGAADRTIAVPLLAFKNSGKIKFATLGWGYQANMWPQNGEPNEKVKSTLVIEGDKAVAVEIS